ncbi:hypothetical protein RI367_002103 [Sorochytrium milnesiophthora]
MHPRIALLLLASLLAASVSALYSAKDPITALTDANFDSKVLKSNHTWVVEFYAPWCGHCKQFAPEFKKAAKRLDGVVGVGAVDCDQAQSLCGRLGIQGFPTVKVWYTNTKSGNRVNTDYNGERKGSQLADYAEKRVPQHVKVISATPEPRKSISIDRFYQLENSTLPKALLFSEKSTVPLMYKSLAISLRYKMVLGQIASTESELTREYGVTKFPTLKVVQTDGAVVDYDGKIERKSVQAFLKKYAAAPSKKEQAKREEL